MSMVEILSELDRLGAPDRRRVFERLCELQDQDLLQGVGPTEEEKALLDAELEQMERDGGSGRPWREVMQELRSGIR